MNSRKKNKTFFGNCKICHDKATGVHYGVTSCEGCKVKESFSKIWISSNIDLTYLRISTNVILQIKMNTHAFLITTAF